MAHPVRLLHRNLASKFPSLTWDDFLSQLSWNQGEHVTLIGPTGQGKTTLALQLLPLRDWVVILANKPRDDTMERVIHAGYRRVSRWSGTVPGTHQVLWPAARGIKSARGGQRAIFEEALDAIYRSGGWCIYVDELTWVCRELRLADDMSALWQMARSSGISVVGATQRPAYVPLYAYDAATHLFFWRDNDEVNLNRIGGLGGMAAGPIREAVMRLDKHQVLYVNTRDGVVLTTRVER